MWLAIVVHSKFVDTIMVVRNQKISYSSFKKPVATCSGFLFLDECNKCNFRQYELYRKSFSLDTCTQFIHPLSIMIHV